MSKYQVGDWVRVRDDADSIGVVGCTLNPSMHQYVGKHFRIKNTILVKDSAGGPYTLYTLENCTNRSGAFDWRWAEVWLETPKYKVGDLVRIRPDADEIHRPGANVTSEMKRFLGQIAVIKQVYECNKYYMIEGCSWFWIPAWLEPVTEQTDIKTNTIMNKFQIGQCVRDEIINPGGTGVITNIVSTKILGNAAEFPIQVTWNKPSGVSGVDTYTMDGQYKSDWTPTLIHEKDTWEVKHVPACTFEKYERVLVRDTVDKQWTPVLFLAYHPDDLFKYQSVSGMSWKFCRAWDESLVGKVTPE